MELRRCRFTVCGKDFEPAHPRQEFCGPTCRANQRYVEHPEKGREIQGGALRSVATQPLVEVRGQREEGGASADYLILAREQIARTLLATSFFTADDLEPLGIPEQYRRSVHGSATGYFSGEKPYMEEAGRRKSERPKRKGGKNTVFRITVKGRRELPGLLKGMASPVAEANKRLYGETLAGVSAGVPSPQGTEGPSGVLVVASTDSGESNTAGVRTGEDGLSRASADSGGSSPVASTERTGEPVRPQETLSLLPEPPSLLDHDAPRAA